MPSEAPTPAPKPTLLVVDDEEGPRQSLRIVFKDDYEVVLAETGDRALDIARQRPIDAAILDIRMTGMSGTELLGKLKELDPTIEVIMLTAYETVETARQALRLGACDYLTKPFDLPTMRASVGKAMQRHLLTREVHSNNQKLKELQEEIASFQAQRELLKTRGEIYGSIVHDINGPLTIISGFMEIIIRKIGSVNSLEGDELDQVKDRLAKITRQVTNCIEMSQRYLSFLRKQQTEMAAASVNQLLTNLDEFMRVHPSARHHQVYVHPLATDITASMNATDLHQVLQNLVVNALQAGAAPHRVDVSGEILPVPVEISRWKPGPNDFYVQPASFQNTPPLLCLRVTDDGPGIAPDLIAKIFTPYFTTKAPGQGTGLGLSIVARLISEGRGALHLHSQVGRGTTFTLYLPAN